MRGLEATEAIYRCCDEIEINGVVTWRRYIRLVLAPVIAISLSSPEERRRRTPPVSDTSSGQLQQQCTRRAHRGTSHVIGSLRAIFAVELWWFVLRLVQTTSICVHSLSIFTSLRHKPLNLCSIDAPR